MNRKFLALLAALALFLGGACSDDQDPAVEAGGDTSETTEAESGGGADGGKISITAEDRKFVDVPATIKGGFVEVELKNNGKLVHEAGFVRVDPEKPQAEFLKDLKTATSEQGGVIAPYLQPYIGGGIENVKGGQTGSAKQSLPAGTYYLVCTLTDADSNEQEPEGGEEPPQLPAHMEQGMIQKVTVTGPATVTPPSDADLTITSKEYSFDIKGLTPGKKSALYVNDPSAKEIHMVVAMEFPEGVDEAAAKKAVEAFGGDGPPPPGTPEPQQAGFGGVFQPGGAGEFEMDVKAGRVYAFLCFIQDRAGGPPHVAKGMVTLATVK